MAPSSANFSRCTTLLLLLAACGPRELGSFGWTMSHGSGTDEDAGELPSGEDAGNDAGEESPSHDAAMPGGEPDAAPACPGGGVELCDGVDNDCDGLVDLEDDLDLSGDNRLLAQGARPAVAWSPTGERYGVSYLLSGEVWYRAFSASGQPIGDSTSIDLNGERDGTALHTNIAWGGDDFGVSWSRQGGLGYRRVSPEGFMFENPIDVAPDWSLFGSSELVRFGQGEWLVLFECCRSASALYGARIKADSTALAEAPKSLHPGPAQLTGVAPSGDQLGIAWWRHATAEPYGSFVEWARLGSDLAPLGEPELLAMADPPSSVSQPLLASTPDGYVVVWNELRGVEASQHVLVAELDRAGNITCGPEDLSASFPEGAKPLTPHDIVATERGALLVGDAPVGENNFAVDLVDVRRGCGYGQRFRVAITEFQPFPALATAGEQGVAVVWQDYFEGGSHIMQRALGPSYCEP